MRKHRLGLAALALAVLTFFQVEARAAAFPRIGLPHPSETTAVRGGHGGGGFGHFGVGFGHLGGGFGHFGGFGFRHFGFAPRHVFSIRFTDASSFTASLDVSSSFAVSPTVLFSWVPQSMLTAVGVGGYATARS